MYFGSSNDWEWQFMGWMVALGLLSFFSAIGYAVYWLFTHVSISFT